MLDATDVSAAMVVATRMMVCLRGGIKLRPWRKLQLSVYQIESDVIEDAGTGSYCTS